MKKFKLIIFMKKVIERIKLAISKVFGHILDFILDNGDVAIKVTDIVKDVVNNPLIDWGVALTPTKSDDVLLAKAKKLVPVVSVKLAVVMGLAKEADLSGDPNKVAGKVFEMVREVLPEEGHAVFYRELSGMIGEALADGKITRGELIAILQLKYHKLL